MGQLFSISSIDGAVSSIPTSEEGSHGTSSREHKTAIGPGTTHSSKDLQDVGVIRTKPENLTSKKGTGGPRRGRRSPSLATTSPLLMTSMNMPWDTY